MNGAETLVHTLLDAGVDTVFTHGGMPPEPLAAALERTAGMRCVPGLSEGVVIGAAEGYHRLRQRPAGTRLQQGSGWAPLHHAGKARSGIVHLVGEHDTPSGTEDLTRSAPHWVRTIGSLPGDARAAVIEARHRPGRIATLVLPADLAASPMAPAPARFGPVKEAPAEPIDERQLVAIADQLRQHGPRTLLLLGGRATQARATAWAGKIAAATGCALMAEGHAPRLERGAGRVAVPRLPRDAGAAQKLLARFDHTVLVQSVEPVARFAGPGTRSPRWLSLCSPAQDAEEALHLLCEALAATRRPMATVRRGATRPHREEGPLNPDGIGALLAALIPENAIVVDEALAIGRAFDTATREAAPHEWLPAVGGPIGLGLPVAVGAAIAAPARRVIALAGDGSAMPTLQALWTLARESLDVTVLVFADRGAQAAQRIDRPRLDWVSLSTGHGVPASRVTTLGELADAMKRSLASPGPGLVEVVL